MPRTVDHDERRRELARASWRLVREQGMVGLSIRNLAAAGGWSTGSVRHFLPTHDDILDLAAAEVNEVLAERIRAVGVHDDPRAQFRAVLLAVLPLDEASRELFRVQLAFTHEALTHPDDEAVVARASVHEELAGLLAECLELLGGRHGLGVDDLDQAVALLQAQLDGLSLHLLLGDIDPEQAVSSLDRLLEWLLGDGVPDRGSHSR